MGVEFSQLEVLLVCFDGHQRAAKARSPLGQRIKGSGGTILDEVVVRVDNKGGVHVRDPRRVLAGTLTPALTWGVFGLLAGGGWSGLVIWAVLGALCGGLYAYYTEHLATKNELKRIGTRLTPDSSALLVYAYGTDANKLLADVASESPRLASVATIASDLSAKVTSGEPQPIDAPSSGHGSPPASRSSVLNMLLFRYAGAGTAAGANAQAAAAQAQTKQPTVQTELLLRADTTGRDHAASPSAGVRAFAPSDAVGWALFGVVYGGIVGLAGAGGVLGFTEGAVVTGILWAAFGLVAGTLYGLWAGRAISARRLKPLRPLLPADTSIAVCWAEGPVSDDSIAMWSALASNQLILKFTPVAGGALLEV